VATRPVPLYQGGTRVKGAVRLGPDTGPESASIRSPGLTPARTRRYSPA
jgi:hypothetical protein